MNIYEVILSDNSKYYVEAENWYKAEQKARKEWRERHEPTVKETHIIMENVRESNVYQ